MAADLQMGFRPYFLWQHALTTCLPRILQRLRLNLSDNFQIFFVDHLSVKFIKFVEHLILLFFGEIFHAGEEKALILLLDVHRVKLGGRIPSFLRWPHCFLRVANFLPPGPPDRMAPAVKIHDPVVSLVVFRTTELENIVGVRGIPPSS